MENMDIEEIVPSTASIVTTLMVKELARLPATDYVTPAAFTATIRRLGRKYKALPSKRDLGVAYRALVTAGQLQENPTLQDTLIQKAVRSSSGILNVSVSMPPDKFSCKFNCHFCPNEPGMPRSYLSNEDVFKRAARVDFDTVQQVYSRLRALDTNGHPLDKIEFRVLGGTFSSYDHDVATTFMRDLYYAANTYYEGDGRQRSTLEEEQVRNVTAAVHVVGLGIETRPDTITLDEIVRFRRYGVTRVEMGVQHTDDALLRRVNRGHLVSHSKTAIRLLKDYGFKVEIHIMTDLPGATPDGDMECYRQVLQGPDLIPDYLKDYPCLDVDFTEIKKWKATGKWTPYSEQTPDARDLKEVLIYRQAITPKWVRVNRMQRDFQEAKEGRLGYTSDAIKSNLAQLVTDEAEARGIYCQCIRCCEISTESFDPAAIRYTIHPFTASGAPEFYICAEIPRTQRDLLLGFARLRITDMQGSVIPELEGKTAMIRELHVYGRVKTVGGGSAGAGAQHLGIGKRLLEIAEELAARHGSAQVAVISGIGVRGYYEKRGYTLKGTYMIKDVPSAWPYIIGLFVFTMLLVLELFLRVAGSVL
jgi:ELP3 family radical SAM enzyme/protein acetyltransferase